MRGIVITAVPSTSLLQSFFVLLLLFTPLATANQASSKYTPPVWVATHGDRQVTLLGAVHYGSPDLYPLPKSIYASLESAEALILELDLDSISQREINTILQDTAIRRDSATLKVKDQYCDRVQVNCTNLKIFNPWYQAMILSGAAFKKRGLSPQHGVDRHILAQTQKLNVFPLESIEQQLKGYSNLSPEEQHDMVRFAVMQADGEGHDEPSVLMKAWRSGDTELLERHFSNRPDSFHRTVASKAKRFASRIHSLAGTHDSLFVALGVEHMVVNENVLVAMEALGWDIKFVTNAR